MNVNYGIQSNQTQEVESDAKAERDEDLSFRIKSNIHLVWKMNDDGRIVRKKIEIDAIYNYKDLSFISIEINSTSQIVTIIIVLRLMALLRNVINIMNRY